MQAYTSLKPTKATEILSPPPKSGTFSVYSQKLTALAFVWLCSVVVWGNVTNFAGIARKCPLRCGFQIAFGVIAFVYVSILLALNALTECNVINRVDRFSHGVEAQFTAVLTFLWIPLVASSSTYQSPTHIATVFSWLGFFGSIYASYKAYHSFKEEDLPSPIPDGFDEENYVYG